VILAHAFGELSVLTESNQEAWLVVVGAGELGARVAGRWVADGGRCVGITQTCSRHDALRAAGVQPCLLDDFQGVERPAHWLFSCPGSLNQSAVLASISPAYPPTRAVLCSSTVLFRPQETKRKRDAQTTERTFHIWSRGHGVALRLGGLYHEGRGPYASLKNGRVPVPAPGNRLLPLLHYEDAATAILNALKTPHPQPWYSVFVSPSPTRRSFYALAGERAGINVAFLDAPPTEAPDWQLERTQEDLLPHPKWPDWREAVS
jgi:hypothetical protein